VKMSEIDETSLSTWIRLPSAALLNWTDNRILCCQWLQSIRCDNL